MENVTDRLITLAALFNSLQRNSDWVQDIDTQQRGHIEALFDTDALEQAIQYGLGSLQTLPWIYHPYTNSVTELTARGNITIIGQSPGAEWRGVLLAWLTGNNVCVVSNVPTFWKRVLSHAAQLEVFVPFCVSLTTEAVTAQSIVNIPEQLPLSSPAGDGIRYEVAEQAKTPYPLALDLADAWSSKLLVKIHRAGISLTAVRQRRNQQQRERQLDRRLRFLLYKIRRLPYYNQQPQPEKVAHLSTLPILTKQELEQYSPPNGHEMASSALPSGEVLVSGASGGKQRYIPYSHNDWQNMLCEAVQTLYDCGLGAGDKVVNTLYGGHMYGGMLTSSQELALMPVESYTVGQGITPEELVVLYKQFGINTIIGIPSMLDTLLTEAKKLEPTFTLDKVIYGGSLWPESRKKWLEQALEVKVIRSILAANDGAQIGYQNQRLSGANHYLVDDYNYVEIVDEDGLPVPDGQRGHILITNWQKNEYPLIRYKIGDVGRIVHRDEQGNRVLEFLGRSDGLIILNSRNAIYYQQIADVLADVPVSQLQLIVDQQEQFETLQINIESPQSLDTTALKQQLLDALPALRPDNSVSEKLLQFRLHVIQVAQGGLARSPISGKVRLIEDLRYIGQKRASS